MYIVTLINVSLIIIMTVILETKYHIIKTKVQNRKLALFILVKSNKNVIRT